MTLAVTYPSMTTPELVPVAGWAEWDKIRVPTLHSHHGRDALIIVVYGKAIQQGSKNVNRNTGAVYETTDAELKPWREAISWAVQSERPEMIRRPNPVLVESHFTKRRPDSHYGTGRNAGQLKPWAKAVRHCTTTPDGDKLKRAVMDALTAGGAYEDDSQVARGVFEKWYTWPGGTLWALDRPGAVIIVRGL